MSFVILFFVLTSFSFAEYGSGISDSASSGGSTPDFNSPYVVCSTDRRYSYYSDDPNVGITPYSHYSDAANVRMIPIDIIIDGQKQNKYFVERSGMEFDGLLPPPEAIRTKGYLCSYSVGGRMHYYFTSNMFTYAADLTKNQYERIKSQGEIMLRRTKVPGFSRPDHDCVPIGSRNTNVRVKFGGVEGRLKDEVICLDEKHYAFTGRLWNNLTNFLSSSQVGSECDEELPPMLPLFSPLTTEKKEVKRENPRPPSQPDSSKPKGGTMETDIKEKKGRCRFEGGVLYC